jgi:hypothetical protein
MVAVRHPFLPVAERPKLSPSINGHRYERWERSFPATTPSFKPFPDIRDLFLMSIHTDLTCIWTVLERSIAGAFGW